MRGTCVKWTALQAAGLGRIVPGMPGRQERLWPVETGSLDSRVEKETGMRTLGLQRWLAAAVLLALPVVAHAQEATLSGTVTDTTGGALPGVTVRAVHEASGNSFEAVTDERGDFRMPVRVGAYKVTADLSGFAPVTRAVTLLVGQEAVVNLEMSI